MRMKDIAVKLGNILDRLAEGALYDNLHQSLIDLDKLLVDIKTNPSKYINLSIFGRIQPKKSPEVDE